MARPSSSEAIPNVICCAILGMAICVAALAALCFVSGWIGPPDSARRGHTPLECALFLMSVGTVSFGWAAAFVGAIFGILMGVFLHFRPEPRQDMARSRDTDGKNHEPK